MLKHKAYLRFIALAHALDEGVNEQAVDASALRLLEAIAVAHSNNKPMTVTEAMALNSIASPATLHRKLDALREAGFIDLQFEGKNRRTKYIVPTKLANERFTALGQLLSQAF